MKSFKHLLDQLDIAYQKNLIKNYFVDVFSPPYISVALHDPAHLRSMTENMREKLIVHIQNNYENVRVETCRLRYNVMWIYCEKLSSEDVDFIKQRKTKID